MASRTATLSVRCPNCGAEPGQRCLLSRRNWRGGIHRTAMHRERHDAISAGRSKPSLVPGRGWPNALQARQIIEDEAERLGSKGLLASKLDISQRYLTLVLCGERNPVHESFLKYFGWKHVYEVAPEDDI